MHILLQDSSYQGYKLRLSVSIKYAELVLTSIQIREKIKFSWKVCALSTKFYKSWKSCYFIRRAYFTWGYYFVFIFHVIKLSILYVLKNFIICSNSGIVGAQ